MMEQPFLDGTSRRRTYGWEVIDSFELVGMLRGESRHREHYFLRKGTSFIRVVRDTP